MTLTDAVNDELGNRKLSEAMDKGVIPFQEIAEAPIVLVCCNLELPITASTCPDCGRSLE